MKPWVAVAILALALGLLFLIMKPRRSHHNWFGPGGTRREGFYGGAFNNDKTDYKADAMQNRKDQRAYKTMG